MINIIIFVPILVGIVLGCITQVFNWSGYEYQVGLALLICISISISALLISALRSLFFSHPFSVPREALLFSGLLFGSYLIILEDLFGIPLLGQIGLGLGLLSLLFIFAVLFNFFYSILGGIILKNKICGTYVSDSPDPNYKLTLNLDGVFLRIFKKSCDNNYIEQRGKYEIAIERFFTVYLILWTENNCGVKNITSFVSEKCKVANLLGDASKVVINMKNEKLHKIATSP